MLIYPGKAAVKKGKESRKWANGGQQRFSLLIRFQPEPTQNTHFLGRVQQKNYLEGEQL